MKPVAVTAVGVPDALAGAVGAQLGRYGLQALGGPWTAPEAPADKPDWRPMIDSFVARRVALWLIVAGPGALAAPAARYALGLMGATLRAELGAGLPIALLQSGAAPKADAGAAAPLPALLADALRLDEGGAWPAKLVAAVHRPPASVARERLAVHGSEQLGQWFELAPAAGVWPGLVFGVTGEGAAIDFQAVGPSGALPEKTTLAYAQQGLELQSGARRFSGWALRNEIGQTAAGPVSYYARVRGCPQAILWLPFTEDDDAQASVLDLF